MSVFFIRHAQDGDDRLVDPRHDPFVKLPQGPIPPVAAIAPPSGHKPRFGAMRFGQPLDGGEIAFKIPTGNTETGRNIGVSTDAPVELQRRHDFAPIGTDFFAHLR